MIDRIADLFCLAVGNINLPPCLRIVCPFRHDDEPVKISLQSIK
jgi:hypothetical protein